MLGTMPGSPAARPGRMMPGGGGPVESKAPRLYLPSAMTLEARTTTLALEGRTTSLTLDDPKGELTLNG